MKSLIALIFCLFLFSCSTMQSGQFVLVKQTDTLEELAETFGTTKEKIIAANQGREFRVGNWYFIPQKRGFGRIWDLDTAPNDLAGSLPAEAIVAGPLLWPVPSSTKISSGFGQRWGRAHQGIDIPGRRGTAILAADDGTVIYSAQRISGYGKMIIISHSNGLKTVYAHNDSNLVSQGQKVYRGQVIAKMGKTGRSTGVHLHFEVRKGRKSINPTAYVSPSRKMIIAKRD
jgi:murein DD-endopeptidase MepM/ murein hydrolase activator NlpD